MFGFHTYSENPFSTLTADGGGGSIQSGVALLEASGELFSAGSLYITSQDLLENSGSLTPNGSLYVSAVNALEGSGSLTANGTLIHGAGSTIQGVGVIGPNGTLIASGASLILDAGEITAYGTLIQVSQSAIEGSGELNANDSLTVNSAASLQSSGTLNSNNTIGMDGASLVLHAGEITPNGTLIHGADSVTEGSGELISNNSLIATSQASIIGSGTIGAGSVGGSTLASSSLLAHGGTLTANGSVAVATSASLESSGTLTSNNTMSVDSAVLTLNSGTIGANGTLINSGKSSIVGSGELSPAASLLAIGSTSLENSGTLDSNIMALRGIQAVVGTTYDEFIYSSHRLNYKPALPRLLGSDIALDFPINEGGGSVFSASSRSQIGAVGNLSWGRVDGRMALTSPGGSNDYRITTSSNGLEFDNTTLVISFKPTTSYPFATFLFNMRGTSQNNNEIDIYCITSTETLYIDVYDGTTLQRTTITGVSINTWHNLAITIGTDLKAYLNGVLAGTYSSITMPSTIDDSIYIGGTAGNDQAFRGSIDHFRWYNRQLPLVEIASLSNNMSQDYHLARLVPNHYQMSQIITGTPILSSNLSALLVGQATITAFPWLGGVSFESSGILTANGVILNELDVVPFTTNINQVENYTNNIYQIYAQTTNINRLHTKSFEK